MTKKILLMGASSSVKADVFYTMIRGLESQGKTVSAITGDDMRTQHKDWDYSAAGLDRQATRMREWAALQTTDYAICDFACPAESQRQILQADYSVMISGHDFENFPEYSAPAACDHIIAEEPDDLAGTVSTIVTELTAV